MGIKQEKPTKSNLDISLDRKQMNEHCWEGSD